MACTADDFLAMRKGRVQPIAADFHGFLRPRLRDVNVDLLNRFNPGKHSEDAIAEVGAFIFSVVRTGTAAKTVITEEASDVLVDIILHQAALDSADVNGPTMMAIRNLVTAVAQGRGNTSQMVMDLLNADKPSNLNAPLEAKRQQRLADTLSGHVKRTR